MGGLKLLSREDDGEARLTLWVPPFVSTGASFPLFSRKAWQPTTARNPLARRVIDTIEISEFTLLGDLIRYLETIRDNLPAGHEAEMRIRGDEQSGRRLTITYFREQTADEIALERERLARGAGSGGDKLEQLQHQLNGVAYDRSGGRSGAGGEG